VEIGKNSFQINPITSDPIPVIRLFITYCSGLIPRIEFEGLEVDEVPQEYCQVRSYRVRFRNLYYIHPGLSVGTERHPPDDKWREEVKVVK
jgi:hypothetical protein